MPDQFKEVTTKGYGSRIIDSLKRVVVGIILFVVSFGVLYWNEGRLDFSGIAKDAVKVDATETNIEAKTGQTLVALSGVASSKEVLGDTFGTGVSKISLESGKYLALKRTVEIYAWVEEKESKSKKNLGGSETTETTYNYKKEWVSLNKAAKSKDFKHPEDHQNPEPFVIDKELRVKIGQVGSYQVDMTAIELPEFSPLDLTDDMVVFPDTDEKTIQLINQKYIYVGVGTVEVPEIGDVRVSYDKVPVDLKVTGFGKIEKNYLTPFVDKKGNKLYRMFVGTKDEAVATLHSEYTNALWGWRIGGFLMMWIGLMLFFGPVSTLLDVVPVFGSLSKGVIGVAAFVVSFILSIVTIFVSMILHSLVAVIIALVVVVGALILGLKFLRKTKPAIKLNKN